jgi:regulator of RNase E activity RraA
MKNLQEQEKIWNSDEELFSLMLQELFTAVVGDIMDEMGYFHQFLPPSIQGLDPNTMMAGRAMTVLEADLTDFAAGSKEKDKPFGLMLEALDDLKKNEIYICSGSENPYALWGELMSIRAKKLGSLGAVLNGYSRDTKGILGLAFPVFSFGSYAKDQGPRGKVIDYRIPIVIGDVTINPGDIVFGDKDGVCIVPQSIEEQIILKALKKARGENLVRKAILEGMSASEAFHQFGIM